MLDLLQALDALERKGTTVAAGTALRLSQSAVSKRVAALEDRLGYAVIERHGRRVRLTPAGHRLLTQARPLLAQLQAILQDAGDDASPTTWVLGVSESILATWGAGLLRQALETSEGWQVEVHAHRSPVVLDRVRAGDYALGLCAGVGDAGSDLAAIDLGVEEMVVIPSGLQPLRLRRGTPVITIEEHAATWSAIRRATGAAGLRVTARVESFAAIARMAIEGLGHALVPAGVAAAAGLDRSQVRTPASCPIRRPVRLVGRPGTLGRAPASHFAERLAALAPAAIAPWDAPTA